MVKTISRASRQGRRMNRTRMIVALALTYAVFAVLLNSVGTVILQSIEIGRAHV